MIKYSLVCHEGHGFEAWFSSGDAYETQSKHAQVICPNCGSHTVDKAIMAPAVARRAGVRPAAGSPTSMPVSEPHRILRKLRDEIHAKAEYVGGRFAEERSRDDDD